MLIIRGCNDCAGQHRDFGISSLFIKKKHWMFAGPTRVVIKVSDMNRRSILAELETHGVKMNE